MKYTFMLFNLIFLTLFTTGVPVAHAEVRQINEDQAMTAFVANVARYVTWPTQQGDTVVIGILGKGNLSREWQSLSGRIINGRRYNVIKSADTYDMIDCHIVVIEETNTSRLSRSLLVLRRHPIITISSSSDFAATGSTINVALTNNRITFTVNLGQARSVGLDISSNLLKLANEVIR